MKSTETNILGASKELKEIVIESGHMAESLFERVNTGYDELKVCICYVVLSTTLARFKRDKFKFFRKKLMDYQMLKKCYWIQLIVSWIPKRN